VKDTRFRAILDFYKIELSDEEYRLLKKRFMGKASNEINYVEFDNTIRTYSGDFDAYKP